MGQTNITLLPRALPPELTVEVVRSFSYKLNVGNYESRDFFCSEKAQCKAEDAEHISDLLYRFCKTQVLEAVREYMAEKKQRDAVLESRKARTA